MFERFSHFLTWFDDEGNVMIVVVLLVGVASFGLGRSSVSAPTLVESRPGINRQSVVHSSEIAGTQVGSLNEEKDASEFAVAAGNFVASRNGTKYHALTCPGAKQISEQNKIYFTTEDEAKAAGYTRAANCTL